MGRRQRSWAGRRRSKQPSRRRSEPEGTASDGIPYSVDSVSPANTTTGTFASRNVANGVGVTTAATVTGTGASNYSVTQQSGLTANITAKALTAQGSLALSSKVYNGTT